MNRIQMILALCAAIALLVVLAVATQDVQPPFERLAEVSKIENGTTSENILADKQQTEDDTATSSVQALKVIDSETSSDALEKKWTKRNLLMREPCDFEEMEAFADELLKQRAWIPLVGQYPNQVFTRKTEQPFDILTSERWLHNCYLDVVLTSNYLSQADLESRSSMLVKALELINPDENYSSSSAIVFMQGNIPLVSYAAGGPMGDSFGTYHYDKTSGEVRLFQVAEGFIPTLSPYEADELGNDMCPCQESIRIRITNPLAIEDFETALIQNDVPLSIGDR